MDTVRWGLLSTAHINRRVIPGIRASKRGELAAVASRDLQKGQAYAAQWQIPRVFGSYEAMLASDEIDAVYISVPNHLHCEWTVKALEAGKHVLCEKPFATTVEEVDRMAAASRKAGRVLAEAFMYLHHPQTKLVHEWVHSGRLGELMLFHSNFCYFMQNREGNVRLVPEYGGGALWDVGVYPVSYARSIFGQAPEAVAGQQWVGETNVDENFSGQLHFPDGRSAQFFSSFTVPYITAVEIHGTRGRITLSRPYTNQNEKDSEVVFTPLEGQPEKIQAEKLDAYQAEIEDMHAAILDSRPPLISLEQSRDHIAITRALYESARTGKAVRPG